MSAEHVTRDGVLAALTRHVGAERGASIHRLTAEVVGSMFANEAAERAVRHRIEELRSEGHHICAHPTTGYHMAATEEELDRTCLYLHDRAMTSLRQVAAMKRVSLPDLRGQLRLPAEPREDR